MKKTLPFLLALGTCTFTLQNAEAHSHTYIVEEPAPTYMMVETAPPAEVEEEIAPSPGVNYVWIKGHWQWDGARWVRVHGHWIARPHERAVWVPGYWREHHHHWRWTEGYWQ